MGLGRTLLLPWQTFRRRSAYLFVLLSHAEEGGRERRWRPLLNNTDTPGGYVGQSTRERQQPHRGSSVKDRWTTGWNRGGCQSDIPAVIVLNKPRPHSRFISIARLFEQV